MIVSRILSGVNVVALPCTLVVSILLTTKLSDSDKPNSLPLYSPSDKRKYLFHPQDGRTSQIFTGPFYRSQPIQPLLKSSNRVYSPGLMGSCNLKLQHYTSGLDCDKSYLGTVFASNFDTTFTVAPVAIDKSPLSEVTIKDFADKVEQSWLRKDDTPLEFETGETNHKRLIQSPHRNGFLGAVLTAYNGHKRLILSPDDWWMVIAHQVSQFISRDENAEKYRNLFVSHQGKMNLVVRGEPLGIVPKSPEGNKHGWPLFVGNISRLIAVNTKQQTKDLIIGQFSTTGPVETTAYGVVLMEAMKQYFTYILLLMCGIPEVTLEGADADYADILRRIDRLSELLPDFQWYLGRVREHMVKIQASKAGQGSEHRDWWRTMVTARFEGSGGQQKFSGWLADFFAYIGPEVENRGASSSFDNFDKPVVTFTDVKLIDGLYTMKTYEMKFVAGFYGCAVDDSNDNAVRPAIGWGTFYWKESFLG